MAACRELHDFERQITSGGFYEIGEIRRRLGDLAAAEEAYAKANELGSDPQPGLSLLRLAEGKVGAATAGITRSLQEAELTPTRLRRLRQKVVPVEGGRYVLDPLHQSVVERAIGTVVDSVKQTPEAASPATPNLKVA